MPAVSCAPRARGRVGAEEALLGYQVLLSVHQIPHVVILQQGAVEGAVQGAGGAQVLILGSRKGQSREVEAQPGSQTSGETHGWGDASQRSDHQEGRVQTLRAQLPFPASVGR